MLISTRKQMDLHLDKNKTLFGIKQEFQAAFPNLKLEFFKHGHDEHEGSPKSDMITEDLPLESLLKGDTSSHLSYNADITIGDFEAMLKEYYGLNVQVFRKSNDVWLQTINSDDKSLREVNSSAHPLVEGA